MDKSDIDSPRPIDLAIHQSFVNIKKNWAILSRRKIATWQGLLIILFISGFISALFLAGYRNLYTGIFADTDQVQITNTANVVYQDSIGVDYGPITATVIVAKTETQDNVPPAKITDLTASTITSTSVGLTWTAPGDDGDVGTATSYDIRYSTKKINDKDDKDWDDAIQIINEPVPQTAGLTENYTVSQLTSDSDYWFAVKTSDGLNESALSNVLSIKIISAGRTVTKITISLPKNYDENVKVVVIDTTGNELEEVKTKTTNQKIDIILKQELNYGQYYILIIAPYHLSKKMEVDLDVDDKNITVGENELPVGNLFDGDDVINAADWDIMRNAWGSIAAPEADLNQDGLVNTLDWSMMKKNWNARGACLSDATESDCRSRE